MAPGQELTTIDSVEWEDIEKERGTVATKPPKPDCGAVIRHWPSNHKHVSYIHVRGDLARRIEACMDTRLKIQQSDDGTMLRIVADDRGGWAWNGHRGYAHLRVQLGIINSWPAEARAEVRCEYQLFEERRELIVKIPAGWLQSSRGQARQNIAVACPERLCGAFMTWGQRVLIDQIVNHGSVRVENFKALLNSSTTNVRRTIESTSARLIALGVCAEGLIVTGGIVSIKPVDKESLLRVLRQAGTK